MPPFFLSFLLLALAAAGAAGLRAWARRPAPPDPMTRTWVVLAACFATAAAWLARTLPA